MGVGKRSYNIKNGRFQLCWDWKLLAWEARGRLTRSRASYVTVFGGRGRGVGGRWGGNGAGIFGS